MKFVDKLETKSKNSASSDRRSMSPINREVADLFKKRRSARLLNNASANLNLTKSSGSLLSIKPTIIPRAMNSEHASSAVQASHDKQVDPTATTAAQPASDSEHASSAVPASHDKQVDPTATTTELTAYDFEQSNSSISTAEHSLVQVNQAIASEGSISGIQASILCPNIQDLQGSIQSVMKANPESITMKRIVEEMKKKYPNYDPLNIKKQTIRLVNKVIFFLTCFYYFEYF